MFHWYYFKKNHELLDPIHNYKVDEFKVNFHFLGSWIKSKEHKELFGWWYNNNHNFIFETIYDLLQFPDSKHVGKRGFPFLSKIVRLVGHTNLKGLKVHLNPSLHFFPKSKLHLYAYVKAKGPQPIFSAYLNIYRPSTIRKFNIEYHITKWSCEFVYIKSLSNKSRIVQTSNMRYTYLYHILERMDELTQYSNNINKYSLKQTIIHLYYFEILMRYILKFKYVKKKKANKILINTCFFMNKSNLLKFDLSHILHSFLCKFVFLSKRKKYIFNYKKKKTKVSNLNLEKLNLNIKYIHPSRISNTSNWRRLKQIVLMGDGLSYGWKSKLDVFSDHLILQNLDFTIPHCKVPLFLNSNFVNIRREQWEKPEDAFVEDFDLEVNKFKKNRAKNLMWRNKKLFLMNTFSALRLKIKIKNMFKVYEHPRIYIKRLARLEKQRSNEIYNDFIWHLRKFDKFFWNDNYLDFLTKKVNSDFFVWNYSWKLKNLSNPLYFQINPILNLENKSYLLKNFKNNFSKSRIGLILPFFSKKIYRYGNVLGLVNKWIQINKNKKEKKIKWKIKKKIKSPFLRIHRVRFAIRRFYIKQNLLHRAFNKNLLNALNLDVAKKSFLNGRNNIIYENYQIMKPDSYHYKLKIHQDLKHLIKLKKDYLEGFIENYIQKRKQLLWQWTFKHEFISLNLNIICFYRLFHELYIAFVLSLKKEEDQIYQRYIHKRALNSYSTKYQVRRWEDTFNKSLDIHQLNFDKKLPLIKDITAFYFNKVFRDKDSLLKVIYFRIFLAIINLFKIKKFWRFEPYKNIFLLIILFFFKKIFLLNTYFTMYKEIKTIFLNLKFWVNDEKKTEFLNLLNLKIYYNNIFLNNIHNYKIWPNNLPSSKLYIYFMNNIKSQNFPFLINWEFIHFYKLRKMLICFRFKQAKLNFKFNKESVGHRFIFRSFLSIFNSFIFSGVGSLKFFNLRIYKSNFLFSNTLFYKDLENLVKDITHLHNPQPFYYGYYTTSHKSTLIK